MPSAISASTVTRYDLRLRALEAPLDCRRPRRLGIGDRTQRATRPSTDRRIRVPPTRPITRAGTPSRAARRQQSCACAGAPTRPLATRTRRRASARRRTCRGIRARPARRRPRRGRRRSSTRPASPPARPRRSRAPTRSDPACATADQHPLQRRLARQIERRRHATHQTVHDLQVLAAAQLAVVLAEQDRPRRPRRGMRRRTTASASSISPTTPRPASAAPRDRPSRCRG